MSEPAVIEVVVAGPQGPVGPVGPAGPENTKATEEVHAEKTAREVADASLSSAITAAITTAETAAEAASDAKGSAASAKAEAEAKAATEVATRASKAELASAEAKATSEAGSKLAKAENLKDLASVSTARSNLGLGSAAVEPASAFDAKGAAATAQTEAEAVSIPLTQKGTANGVPSSEKALAISGEPLQHTVLMGNGAGKGIFGTPSCVQFLVNITDFGATSALEDNSSAIEEAQKFAEEQPGNWGLFFPGKEFKYAHTLPPKVPWFGVPRRTVLTSTAAFTFSGFLSQFCIANPHAATTYNAANADTVIIEGIDFSVEGAVGGGKGLIGLANVAGGRVWNCKMRTTGTNAVEALLDVYACVKNFAIDCPASEQLTEANKGGCVWIRNMTSEPTNEANNTENIYVSPRSRFAGTTEDETVAIFGGFGKVNGVLLDMTTHEAMASSANHQRTLTVFPSANSATNPHAAVEKIEIRRPTVIDIHNTLKENGVVIGLGRGTATANVCQNVKVVNPTVVVSTSAKHVVAIQNAADAFEGPSSQITVSHAVVNATGSAEPICGLEGVPKVDGGTTIGNIETALRRCGQINGGNWEATSKIFHDCASVAGNYQTKFPSNTGTVFFRESATSPLVASYGKGENQGGNALLVVRNTVTSASTINMDDATITTTAEAGNVVEVQAGETTPVVNLRNNTFLGEHALAISGTIAQRFGNYLYGKADPMPIGAEAITGPMIAKNAITSANIEKETVLTVNIATGAVTEAKLAAEAVSAGKIKAEAVTEAKIAKEAVNTEQIKALSVTSAKIAVGAVAESKLAAEAVVAGKVATGAITEEKIANAAVTEVKLGAESVASIKIKAEAVTETKIAKEAVNSEQIKASAVTAAKIATGAVSEAKIAAEAVTAGKIKIATTPAASAEENKTVLGSAGVGKKIVVAITGNNSVTKWKIVHNLGTRAIVSDVLTESFEKPVTNLAKVTALTENEVEVTFTVAPGAKVVNYLILIA